MASSAHGPDAVESLAVPWGLPVAQPRKLSVRAESAELDEHDDTADWPELPLLLLLLLPLLALLLLRNNGAELSEPELLAGDAVAELVHASGCCCCWSLSSCALARSLTARGVSVGQLLGSEQRNSGPFCQASLLMEVRVAPLSLIHI